MEKQNKELWNYVNAAADLAELLKKAIKKDKKITNEIVVALNAFIIAANEVEYVTSALYKINVKTTQ
jgi:hypothetical protein